MPRIRSGQRVQYDRAEFVQALYNELTADADPNNRQPLILEEEIPETDTIHVVAYWDRWATVPTEERSAIILDAYERLDPTMVQRITFAMGVTSDEADDLQLLPYSVTPLIRETDTVDRSRLRRAMLEEGGREKGDTVVLRFPTRELAEASYRRLADRIPEGHWSLQQVVAALAD